MAQTSKIAYLLQRLAQGVASHDRENPEHHTWGIGMAHFDIERLGLEEGEEILPGIVLQADGGVTGAFRVRRGGERGEGAVEEEGGIMEAVAAEGIWQPPRAPGGGTPPPLQPPL